MVKAVYALGECRGEVEFESTGYMWMTKVVKLEVLPTAEQQRQSGITEIDQKIAVLKQQIIALEEMRAGLAGSNQGSIVHPIAATATATPPTPVTTTPFRPQISGLSAGAAHSPTTPSASSDPAPPPGIANASSPSRDATSKGQPILTGPRGGRYHYSGSGKKVYERRSR
jgi:hypothetical protein